MTYSILKYSELMLSDVEDLEKAKEEALRFVTPKASDYLEIQDSTHETVTIGYFDGTRFHWTKDKIQTEATNSCSWTTQPLPQQLLIASLTYTRLTSLPRIITTPGYL